MSVLARIPGAALALGLLAVAGRCGPAVAAAYHVDPTAPPGGDGSAGAPFRILAEALEVAIPMDCIYLSCGVYDETIPVRVDGRLRAAVLPLSAGIRVIGSGAGCTVLRVSTAPVPTYGITAEGLGPETLVSDLSVEGACFQGINLRSASPTFRRVEVRNDVTGGSSVALDARDGSFPQADDCVFAGGHSAVFVEFGSGGRFTRCRLARRPHDTLVVIGSVPELVDCVLEPAGRDTIVLSQNAQPRLRGCTIGRGDRWAVRVAAYDAGTRVDLGGNRWFSADPLVVQDAILDARDDPALGARVTVIPLLDPVVAEVMSFGEIKGRFAPPVLNAPR